MQSNWKSVIEVNWLAVDTGPFTNTVTGDVWPAVCSGRSMQYCNLWGVSVAVLHNWSLLAALPLAPRYKSLHFYSLRGLIHSFPLPSLPTHQEPFVCVGFDLCLAHECSNSIFCPIWLAGAPLKLTMNLNIETWSVGSCCFPSQHTIFQCNQPVWGSWLKKQNKTPFMSQLVRFAVWVFNLNILPGS